MPAGQAAFRVARTRVCLAIRVMCTGYSYMASCASAPDRSGMQLLRPPFEAPLKKSSCESLLRLRMSVGALV
jgi:hypothetical protein